MQSGQQQDQRYVSSAFTVYATEVRKAIKKQEKQLYQLEHAHEQLQQTLDSLQQLPSQLRHQVMVPMGKHAFFPGQLTRTNEILVHLGDQYYVEVTAAAARGILLRKQAVVADGVSKAQQQLKGLQARLDVSAASLGTDADVDQEDAFEIRSSVAESDALLSSARKGRKPVAATQPQQQQQLQRVKSASGYSYTPLPVAAQRQQTAAQAAEDAALQSRLQELMLLEQLQEQEQEQQGKYPEQGQGLGTIQEEEEDDMEETAELSGAATAAAGSRQLLDTSLLSAVQHLQQLEVQSDSDDEEEHEQEQQQQQQHASQQPAQEVSLQQQQQQQQQPVLHPQQQQQPAAQPAQGAAGGKAPLKSALKKGFFTSARSSRASTDRTAAASSSSASSTTSAKPVAFTGTVVERPAASDVGEDDAAVVAGPVPLVEHSPAASSSSNTSVSGPEKKVSKFKLRRMGMEG